MNKKLIITSIFVFIMAFTLVEAVTYTPINNLGTDAVFRRLTDDLAITWTNNNKVMSVEGNGEYFNYSVITASHFVKYCHQDIANPYKCMIVSGSNLITVDFQNRNVSSIVLPPSIAKSGLMLQAKTPNEYFFTYLNVSHQWLVTSDLVNDETINYTLPSGVPEFSTVGITGYKLSPMFTTYDSDNGYAFWQVFYRQDTDTVVIGSFFDNDTGTTSFGYDSLSYTGLCYNETGTNRFYDDTDFPNSLFANYGYQSETLVIKPSCRGYIELYLDDYQNITGWQYPTTFTRNEPITTYFTPTMHYPSGMRIGARNLLSSYYQDEVMINGSNGFIDFFTQDTWVNEGVPIYAYNLDSTEYYVGFYDNIWATFPLSSGTLVYPTGLYDYTVATNLSTLTQEGVQLTIQDSLQTSGSGNNIDLQVGSDKRTYVLSHETPDAIVSIIDTTSNTNISVVAQHVVFSSITPVSISGTGIFSLAVPSNNYYNLGVAGVSKIRQFIDYDNYPTYTHFNYTTTNTIKTRIIGNVAGAGQSDILTLTDTGTVVNMYYGRVGDAYPKTTYTATKSSGFAPLDIEFSCTTAGNDDIYIVTAISGGGSGVGRCYFDRTDTNPTILCSASPIISTDTYPYSTKVGGISTFGQYATAYKNSSSIVNVKLTTCTTASTITQESICTIGAEYGTIRTVLRVNASHSLAGTTLGYLGICNVNTSTMDVQNLGTITTNGEEIIKLQTRYLKCSGTGCAESTSNIHLLSEQYYVKGLLEQAGQTVPNFCGNLNCIGGENANTCPIDCSATCGDTFCTHSETSMSCPADCGGAVCGNSMCEGGETILNCPADCTGVWINLPEPVEEPITYPITTSLKTMVIPSVTGAIIGGTFTGDDKVFKIDLSSYNNYTELANFDLIDFPYSVDYIGGTVFVGTDDELHVIGGYVANNFFLIERRGYGGLHSDRIEDVVAVNNETAFNCDNLDEPDYYELGSEPQGSVGGGCHDIEFDALNDYLYVDANGDGIRFWDVSNINSFELNSTQNFRTQAHDLTGDLLDYKDGLLLAKRNTQSMTVFDVSTPSSPVIITHCNNGGLGNIISVELYNETLAIGGTDTGRISICHLNNNDEENNTETYDIVDFSGEEVRSIELDEDNIIWLMAETKIQAYNLTFTQIINNTPPNITSYTLSSNNVFIGEPIDVQIIAGNVEPEDVVKYGVKCEGTGDYVQNSNGEFTCTYNISGAYNLRMAVSDNYHVGEWYDERLEEVIVGETVFEGGILRIQVLDENQNAIEGANVTANEESKTTTVYGDVTFTTSTDGLYEVMTEKSGYYPSVNNFYADSSIHIVTLELEPTTNETVLQVTVVDANGDKVENALVSYTNTITYDYEYKFTNALGLVVFRNVDAGTVVIQVSKGDISNSVNTNIMNRQINEVEISLTVDTLPTVRLDRDCIDDGIWLCGNVDISCDEDADCLSDECVVGINKCSRFNYSVCDVNGYPRGQTCVIKFSAESGLGNITDWILDNLLWVIMLIVIAVGIGFIFVSWSPIRR